MKTAVWNPADEFVRPPWHRNVMRRELPPPISEDTDDTGTRGGRHPEGCLPRSLSTSAPAGGGNPWGNVGQPIPWRRQIWFFFQAMSVAGSQVHWWILAPAAVEISLTSTHLPLWTAASW